MSETDAIDSKLIDMVQQFPGLYDASSPDHKNPESIATIWQIISKKLKTPTSDCLARWKYLRKRFTQSSAANSWQHFNTLTFLEPFIKRRKLKNNSSELGGDEDVVIVEECEDKKQDNSLPRERKRKKANREENEESNYSFREKNLEEDAVQSFCNSICCDLLKLSPQQLLSCRIDILTVISKYMGMNTNDVNASNSNNNGSAETLVPELMKYFVEVENKVLENTLTTDDKDWVFLYAIKKFFAKLMSLRTFNDELNDLLRNFEYADRIHSRNGSVHNETSSFPTITTTTQCSSNSYSESNGNMLVEPKSDDTKNEFTSTETKSTLVEPSYSYFEEMKTEEVIPYEIGVLKENILLDGVTKDNYCNFCRTMTTNANNHKKSSTHISARNNYFFNFCIQNLNPVIFRIKNAYEIERLHCTFCRYRLDALYYLNRHISSISHRKNTKSVVEKTDSSYCNYIKKGVLKIGTTFRYCLLCQEHIFAVPHGDNLHRRRLMEVEVCCKVERDIFCFICIKSFPSTEYETHKKETVHVEKFKTHYATRRHFYYKDALAVTF